MEQTKGSNYRHLEPDIQAMYAEIARGVWNYNWRADGCQRFSRTGSRRFTFCGQEIEDNYFCEGCVRLKCTQQLQESFRNGEYTPQANFEEKRQLTENFARTHLRDEV